MERSFHAMLLALSVAVLLASMLLSPTDEVVYLLGFPIPELCTVRRLTGLRCPGCGLTRSFTYMGHGEIAAAFRMHLLGPVLYGLVVAQLPLRLWRLR